MLQWPKILLSAAIHKTSWFMVVDETSMSASFCLSENLDHVHCLLLNYHHSQNSTATVTTLQQVIIGKSLPSNYCRCQNFTLFNAATMRTLLSIASNPKAWLTNKQRRERLFISTVQKTNTAGKNSRKYNNENIFGGIRFRLLTYVTKLHCMVIIHVCMCWNEERKDLSFRNIIVFF